MHARMLGVVAWQLQAPATQQLPQTCVDVLQAAQHLVQEELVVFWRQVVIRLYHLRTTSSRAFTVH
jgi:hypothetical protein